MSTITPPRLPAVDVTAPTPDDLQLWSVTTIIGVLDKPALIYWASAEAADCAIHNERTWKAMLHDDGEEAAIKYIRDARFRRPKDQRSAAELGTAVHAACEEYALTGTRPQVDDEVRPFLDQFDEWLYKWQPTYEAAEMTVYHPDYGYAGTGDAIVTIDGMRLFLDYKSTRKSFDTRGEQTKPYPEVGLQLAAYRYAKFAAAWNARRFEKFRRRYYLLSPEEVSTGVPVPEVDDGMVIHITPEHVTMHPVRCDEQTFESFLHVLEAARWKFEMADRTVGPALG